MSIRVALVVPACIAMIIGSPAIAADIPLPTGSYLSTCKVVSFDTTTGDLAANCEGPAVGMFGLGTPDTSRMNVRGCKEGTIWNDRRQLYCLSAEAWGSDRVIPPGSYIDTCTDRKVVGGALLTAVCGASNGVSRNASLDLRNCNWGGDITNSNGNLTCTLVNGALSASAMHQSIAGAGASNSAEPDVVKPVAVAPGVVKPTLVAPLAPAPGGTTGSTREERKKKRKSERGERG